jgi:hypothetical protein
LLAIAGSATRRRKPSTSAVPLPEIARHSKGRGPLQ